MASFNSAVFPNSTAVKEYLEPLRAQGKRVVTTNGCFDLIHAGHVRYLAEAAAQGDILVIGVNADETVRKLKGPNRPIQLEQDRVFLIGSLKMVDCAFIFHEDDPCAFLEIIRPDIHVKGGDYTKDIIERDIVERYNGEIRIVSFVQGYSTTSLVKKIQTTT